MKKIFFLFGISALLFTEAQAQKKTKRVEVREQSGKGLVRIEKDGKVHEEVIDIQAPKTRIYRFNNDDSWQVDSLHDGERVLKYGEGFTWEDSYPKRSKSFEDNIRSLRINSEDLFERLSLDMGNLKNEISLRHNSNLNEGFGQVSIYTNKPETNILNLRFKSVDSSNVTISVVSLTGELIQKETVEDFAGEYMGQITLKPGTKGTFFVIIAQGENGISRKIKID
jgi:hypothetical protein